MLGRDIAGSEGCHLDSVEEREDTGRSNFPVDQERKEGRTFEAERKISTKVRMISRSISQVSHF